MHSPQLNWLLAHLPATDYERMLPHLDLVALKAGTVLFQSGEKDTDLFFPTTCTVSAQIELTGGDCTDVYLLGDRGLFGTGNNLRGSFFKAIVRKPGFAYRCARALYLQEMARSEGVMRISMVAMRIMMEEMAINISCRTFHSVPQRLARWLLACCQGAPDEHIQITHADLAHALGARRERVTLALNQAARNGLLELHRGEIRVIDPAGLQQVSCDCDAEPRIDKHLSSQDLNRSETLPKLLHHLGS